MNNLQIKHVGEMVLKFQVLSWENVVSTQVQKTSFGAGEVAQQLGMGTALPEDTSSVPST